MTHERDDPLDGKTIQDARAPEPLSSGRVPALEPRSISNLSLGDIIGEGGMGIVRSAIQKSLARTVAIKIARPGATERDARRMLREAWVTGYLEHPGVIPVYDIVRGEDETAAVVMRRIDGVTWEDRLVDEAWARREGARDLFEQNLQIFVRVCEIVEFAHAKGVIHRDIKPSNVMLGAFGEVYLLDWGLAVALSGDAAEHLPGPEEAKAVAGTFAYAAPEMVALDDVPLGIHTDVYLLGAVLYELAVGRPPHDRPSLPETIESIAQTPPALPADVSPRFAAICERAMARDPTARFASAAELRRAVVELLHSRGYEELVAAAERTLAKLGEACAAKMARRHVYDLYGECRFAFREVLRASPENDGARRGLARAASIVIEHELARDPRVAAALLEEATSAVEPELAARVRAAAAADDATRTSERRVAQDHDPRVGRRARVWLFALFGVVWIGSQIFSDHVGPMTHTRFGIGPLVQLGILGGACFGFRDLTRTLFNRRLIAIIAITMVATSALFYAGRELALDLAALRVVQIGLWAIMASAATALLERRFWPMSVGLAASFFFALTFPELRALAATVGTIGIVVNVAMIWLRPRA